MIFSEEIIDYFAIRIFSNVNIPEEWIVPTVSQNPNFSSDDVQIVGGKGEGVFCSLPLGTDLFAFRNFYWNESISLQMRQACVTHDYCYRHGYRTYDYSQEDCDYDLLENSIRLCRFINGIDTQRSCQLEAKKVLLGVRLAGSTSFAKENSTYFEYDSYPTRTDGYTAYRIADGSDPTQGAMSLYHFKVQKSGTTVIEQPLHKNAPCYSQVKLAGWPDRITGAPYVIKLQTDGSGNTSDDWFVWWQRESMLVSKGRFVGIAPKRASLADWKKIFPDAEHSYWKFNQPDELCDAQNTLGKRITAKSAYPAHFIAYVGTEKESTRVRVNEFTTAPGLEAPGKLRIMARRNHSCSSAGDEAPTLCVSDFNIDVFAAQQSPMLPHEPLKAKDKRSNNGERTEGLYRYRNYSSPAFAVSGFGDQPPLGYPVNEPVLAWLYRGEGKNGSNYSSDAILRRISCFKNISSTADDETRSKICKDKSDMHLTGKSVVQIPLEGLSEAHEPLAVLGRTTQNPSLISVSLTLQPNFGRWFDWDRYIKFDRWRMIPPEEDSGGKKQAKEIRNTSLEGKCQHALSHDWFYRPPVIIADKIGGAEIVFSRASDDFKTLEFALVEVTPSGVRRQGFWERLQLRLSEILAHRLVDIKRLGCGIANAAV